MTIEDLRPLLVGPEQNRIKRLEERVDNHLEDMVADVLPGAVVKSRQNSERLSWAIEPILGKAIRETVTKHPEPFSEALAPAIGSAIRKATAQVFRELFQRFNEALENSLSLQSVRWRFEARRTARPFAEVVLLRTLVYRVEQVFLIHRGTGLLLQHLTPGGIAAQDPDQVAAMMSALETFAHEAFQENARLERFRVGELSGWVEHGPSAILVAIVRGTASESYEAHLHKILERIHLEHGATLADYRGAPAPLVGVEDVLVDCLQEQRRTPQAQWLPLTVIVATVVAIFVALIGFEVRASRRESLRFEAYLDALRREPGLFVTSAERHAGRYAFVGLVDPLAPRPAEVLLRSGLDPAFATTEFGSFYSLDPRLVERRVARLLRPPDTVTLELRGGTLVARGVAQRGWIDEVRSAARAIPGVEAFDAVRLYPQESVDESRAEKTAIEREELYFPLGSDTLPPEEQATLDRTAAEATHLFALAQATGMTARLEVVGYTDPTGSEDVNRRLSQARAENVVAELNARGVPASRLSARGVGIRIEEESSSTGAAKRGDARARSAVFHVDLYPAANR